MMRFLRVALGALVATATACSGGGSAAPDDGGGGVSGSDAGGGAGGSEVAVLDGPADVPADFSSDGRPTCPAGGGGLAPVEAALLIDDFSGSGLLEGRRVMRSAFTIHEQFSASVNAQFDVQPGIDPVCGAAAAGAAHIAGMPADAGATFAIIFGSGAGTPMAEFYDASATKGITFRAAVGDAHASRVFSVRMGVAGSTWSYTKDIEVKGTAWESVNLIWAELEKAPAAPTFDASKLNQLVLTLTSGADIDIFLDDVAFIR
ncbi:MAG TPA: hypothetical protein VFH73_07820 [Polyangia bacterium]|nr:hypothetical protein [Polyangia bacterium]